MIDPPSRGRSRAGLLLLLVATGCSDRNAQVACPILAPGALSVLPRGDALAVSGGPASISSAFGAGGLVAHALWLAAGEEVVVEATVATNGVLFAYGPRDAFGGYPHCLAVSQGASPKVKLTADEDGEMLVLVGGVPGTGTADYTIGARCEKGCDTARTRCATLSELGCGDVRCDGELARDANGCLTCTCDEGALCGPDRRAGPGGACVLPACDCQGVPSEPVCGADGRTWDSPCAAACADVPVAREGPCAITCPGTCETPCHGLRKLAADGCPTCECASTFAGDAASCAACPIALSPVCGSDGITYPNACRARCAGARLLYAGACTDGCRSAPPGCTLDCANGLRPLAGGGQCLACACADVPASCRVDDGPVCVPLPGPIGETTVGSTCLALALGASDGSWGPCGVRCESDECPEGATCQTDGFLAGRCLASEPPCGCSRLLEPVCGVDGATWDNACVARCAGVAVAHVGACCEAPPTCDATLALDTRGCPVACGEGAAADCAANAATAPACLPDGSAIEGSACAAHARGESAFPEYCP